MTVSRRRVARKRRTCDSCERLAIKPGQVYLAHTGFPSEDFMMLGAKGPSRSKECGSGPIRYQGYDALEPLPVDHGQMFRYWLAEDITSAGRWTA